MNAFMINIYIAEPEKNSVFVKNPVASVVVLSELSESEVLMEFAKNPAFSTLTGSEYTLTCNILPTGFVLAVISI